MSPNPDAKKTNTTGEPISGRINAAFIPDSTLDIVDHENNNNNQPNNYFTGYYAHPPHHPHHLHHQVLDLNQNIIESGEKPPQNPNDIYPISAASPDGQKSKRNDDRAHCDNNLPNGTVGFAADDDRDSEAAAAKLYEVQTSWSVLRQMLIPFTIAGFGSVFAGIVLNAVTAWDVFQAMPQLEIMVPAFLGLIGNIETTLASRLSTHANLGTLDTWHGMSSILIGNFLVVQCQASTVGLFAAIASLVMSAFKASTRSAITWQNALLLSSGSVVTSIIANSLLATVISIVIVLARKFRVNPDNISTPVAASMGDVCSIAILALITQKLYEYRNSTLEISLIVALVGIAPIFGYFARQNRYSRSVIITGWSAILGAVIVEQPGGIVMQTSFEQYKVLSTFQPLVNGIASNLVGIQTSRMSTFLHSVSKKGQLPESNPRACVGPFWVFFSRDTHSRMARLLMAVVIPSHLFYMTFIYLVQNEFAFSLAITPAFIATYCVAVATQLAILLYLAYVSVFWAWRRKINPDNSAIPFTSALADVLGNCLMAAAFTFLKAVNDPNANIIDTGEAIQRYQSFSNISNNAHNYLNQSQPSATTMATIFSNETSSTIASLIALTNLTATTIVP